MDICIRADGGSNIGMGHIMRTLAVAKELSENHNVFYACRVDKPLSDKYKPGIDKIKSEGLNVIYVDENNIINDISKIQADCIITDSYDVDEKYFDELKKIFKISGCLDDEKTCNYFNVDFLINQNIYGSKLNYKVNKDTELMLGCDYVILRNEFIGLSDRFINKTVQKIMITVGGSDNDNLTEKILKKLAEFKGEIYIVVGPGFTNINELMKYKSDNVKLCVNPVMSKLMLECDLAIASCGTTLFELASCGTPTIGIIAAENQEFAAKYMDEEGVIKYSSIENIFSIIKTLDYEKRYDMSIKGKKLVDGMGIKRIVSNIERRFNR